MKHSECVWQASEKENHKRRHIMIRRFISRFLFCSSKSLVRAASHVKAPSIWRFPGRPSRMSMTRSGLREVLRDESYRWHNYINSFNWTREKFPHRREFRFPRRFCHLKRWFSFPNGMKIHGFPQFSSEFPPPTYSNIKTEFMDFRH